MIYYNYQQMEVIMSNYRSYATKNFEISKEQYNYLLPVYGKPQNKEIFLFNMNDKFFINCLPLEYKINVLPILQ